jgi:hypothetical protein
MMAHCMTSVDRKKKDLLPLLKKMLNSVKDIDHSFILRLLEPFDSEDKRERDHLKMVLHRTDMESLWCRSLGPFCSKIYK